MNNQSSINILAMFIISTLRNSRDQSKQMMKQIKLNFNKQDEVSKTSISPVNVCDLKHSRDQVGVLLI